MPDVIFLTFLDTISLNCYFGTFKQDCPAYISVINKDGTALEVGSIWTEYNYAVSQIILLHHVPPLWSNIFVPKQELFKHFAMTKELTT